MATLYADSFTRANDVTNVGSPTTGGPYTERVGTTWGINANQLYTSTSVTDGLITFPAAIDVDFQAVLNVDADSGLVFRYVDTSNFWLLSNSTGLVRLYKKSGGTYYIRANFNAPTFPLTLRVVTKGIRIECYSAGVHRGVFEDDAYAAATATCGFRMNSSTAGRFDDAIAIDSAAGPSAAIVTTTFDTNYGAVGVGAAHVYKGRDRKTDDTSIAA